MHPDIFKIQDLCHENTCWFKSSTKIAHREKEEQITKNNVENKLQEKLNINWEENKHNLLEEKLTTEQQSFTHFVRLVDIFVFFVWNLY